VIWSGKGCSTVLIPERVVQALQLHFDQMAATSGPKPRAFPPLHGTSSSKNLILCSTFKESLIRFQLGSGGPKI
jgi:hypothetical protein